MSISKALQERSQGVCELCASQPAVNEYLVSPKTDEKPGNQVALCSECLDKIVSGDKSEYWRCLEGSIWNAEPAVQALSYRLLHTCLPADWANDVTSSVELDENTTQWALSAFEKADVHIDAFGNELANGDNVVLTQNLNVKGTSFTAPKGTVVKKIRLVPDNTDQIEGKINEQMIVILTKYLKKG